MIFAPEKIVRCVICDKPIVLGEQVVWTPLRDGGLARLDGPDGPGGVLMHFECQSFVDEDGEPT